MSKILGLEKVDTSQLSEGLEVKNYRALCELVGEEPKTGNGKKAQLGKALADSDVQVKFDSSDVQNYNEQLKQLQETSTATQDKLKELQSSTSGESGGGLLSGIDLDYDKASMSIDQLDSKISELTGKREEISVSANTEEGQQAISALDSEIESLQSQKIMLSIGAQLEGGATVDQLLGMSDADLQKTLKIDSSQVEEARSQLEALKEADGDIPITVKLDDSQFKELSSKDQNIDVTVDDSALDNLKSKLDSLDETKDVTVNVTASLTAKHGTIQVMESNTGISAIVLLEPELLKPG